MGELPDHKSIGWNPDIPIAHQICDYMDKFKDLIDEDEAFVAFFIVFQQQMHMSVLWRW